MFLKIKSTLFLFILFIEIVFVNQLTELFTEIGPIISVVQAPQLQFVASRNFPDERRRTAPEIRKHVKNQNKNNNADLPIIGGSFKNLILSNYSYTVETNTPTSIYGLDMDQRMDIRKFYIYLSLSSDGLQI